MFESILTTSTEASISIGTSIISIIAALFLGFIISCIYMLSDKEKRYSKNFAITLVILPAIVAIVIMLVGSNVARAFSLAGAFALVRFRSVPGDSKDIASVFFAMSIGLASGMGYLTYAGLATIIIGLIYVILMRSGFAIKRDIHKELKITIPENMNYQGAFDDLFAEYTVKANLDKVKTTNLGTLYELTYKILMKTNIDEKQFIDSIRCRNANLNIVLCRSVENETSL